MSDILARLAEPQNILFIVFFYITMRMSYAGNHFTGASTIMPVIFTILGALYFIFSLVFLIIVAIKVSIPLAITLFVITFIIQFIFSSWRNRYIFRKLRREHPNESHLMLLSLATAKSNIAIVVFSTIGLIVSIPILFFLVSYLIKLF